MRIAPDLLHGLSSGAGDEVGEHRPVLGPAQQVAARGEAQARTRAVVAGVGHVVGAADLHDARVLAAAGQLVGLGRDHHGLAAAGEADAVARGGEADRGAAVGALGAVEELDQPVLDERRRVEDELRLPRLRAGAEDRVRAVALERAERVADRESAWLAASGAGGRCGGGPGERGGGSCASAKLDQVPASCASHMNSRTPLRGTQPGYGGASPQPQRGTGASGGGSAPGCELASAMRVPHST